MSVIIVWISGIFVLQRSASTPRQNLSVSSARVPTGSLMVTLNCPSSWSGKNSVPMNLNRPREQHATATMPSITSSPMAQCPPEAPFIGIVDPSSMS